MSTTPPKLRCAIYTRKSSEEGLDQSFNSLDAQREACQAFIVSQASLGWTLSPDFYDDGGISGGTMDRPALQRLLADIRLKKIDVVVVYKIDRLTRSLMDFSRIVEIFDRHGVSFVSITQQFNTTSSMGRLTLNVLLSFAQFEREVTAERIRDKVAASKRKGMWMGGNVPLGYRVKDRKLVIDEREAETVRWLFHRYLNLGSINELARETQTAALYRNETPKSRGSTFTRGPLHHILTKPIYIGKIRHKETIHGGEHGGIVEPDLFDQVQALLRQQGPNRRSSNNTVGTHLLGGLLQDASGRRLLLSQAQNHGRRYRYYVSRPIANSDPHQTDKVALRLASTTIEPIVEQQLHVLLTNRVQLAEWVEKNAATIDTPRFLSKAEALSHHYRGLVGFDEKRAVLRGIFKSITVKSDEVTYEIDLGLLIYTIVRDPAGTTSPAMKPGSTEHIVSITVPIQPKRRGLENRIVLQDTQQPEGKREPALVALVARAHLYLEALTDGSGAGRTAVAKRFGTDPAEVSRQLPLAFLAPDIVQAIMKGQQPVDLTIAKITRSVDLPMDWSGQRLMLMR